MTRKRFSEEDILNILRQVELDLAAGSTVESATEQPVTLMPPIINGARCMEACPT